MVSRAVVVAQLVEWSLPIPEVRDSNPASGKINNKQLFNVNCFEKDENKEKEAVNCPYLNMWLSMH